MSINDTLKEALEKLNRFLTKQADPATLTSGKLSDGTEIKYPGELAVGTSVIVVTPEGEIPAPDGEHTLEDGTIIKTEGGNITEIMAVQTKPDPMPAGTVEQMKVLQSRLEVKQATVEDRLANLEAIARVVMEYCYGWELKNEVLEDAKDKAIAAYSAIGAIQPVAAAMGQAVEQLAAIKTLQSDVDKLKAKPATAPLIKPIIGEEDPLKKEVERIQSLQNKTRK